MGGKSPKATQQPPRQQPTQQPVAADAAVVAATTDAEERARMRAAAANAIFTTPQGDLTPANVGKTSLGV